MDFSLIIIGLTFLGIIAGIIPAINLNNKKEEQAKRNRNKRFQKAAEEFHVSAKVVGVENRYQFLVDDVDKNIIFME